MELLLNCINCTCLAILVAIPAHKASNQRLGKTWNDFLLCHWQIIVNSTVFPHTNPHTFISHQVCDPVVWLATTRLSSPFILLFLKGVFVSFLFFPLHSCSAGNTFDRLPHSQITFKITIATSLFSYDIKHNPTKWWLNFFAGAASEILYQA